MLGYTQSVPIEVRLCFTYICYTMAIVNSLAIGKSRKSAGNLTYKTVRGRTIASQRITENKSNSAKQQVQRDLFRNVSMSIALCRAYIDRCYEPSKYGSARNAFQKQNPKFTLGHRVGEIKEGIVPFADGFFSAISRPASGSPQLSVITQGSLACIPQISVGVYATYKAAFGDKANIPYIDGSAVYTFPSGIKYSDVSMMIIGIMNDGVETLTGTFDETGRFTAAEVDNQLALDFGNFQVTSAIADGLISSITVSTDVPTAGEYNMIIAVPTSAGKVPTTFAGFVKEIAGA